MRASSKTSSALASSRRPNLLWKRPMVKPGVSAGTRKHAQAGGDGALLVGARVEEVELGDAAAGDEVLGAVDDVLVALPLGVGLDGGAGLVVQEVRVGAGVRLGAGQAQEEGVVLQELGQPLVALLGVELVRPGAATRCSSPG